LKNRIALFAILLASNIPIAAKPLVDAEVASVIALTRETQSIYSAYFWNKITPDGIAPIEEWSAEFHSGHQHRVETPRDRIIADCKAMTGVHLNVETGEIIEGAKVAKVACGINANPKILSTRKYTNMMTRYGEAFRIEINDSEFRRTYDVSKEGILMAATIRDAGVGGKMRLINKATYISRKLPKGDIFSVDSLYGSVVAERFKKPTK
jgi:hypothetical protein